jgi:excisionase family DNA binding protein
MAASTTYLSTAQVADYLNISKSWLEKLRVSGFGPPFYKVGPRRVLYKREDLDQWIGECRVNSTSEQAVYQTSSASCRGGL